MNTQDKSTAGNTLDPVNSVAPRPLSRWKQPSNANTAVDQAKRTLLAAAQQPAPSPAAKTPSRLLPAAAVVLLAFLATGPRHAAAAVNIQEYANTIPGTAGFCNANNYAYYGTNTPSSPVQLYLASLWRQYGNVFNNTVNNPNPSTVYGVTTSVNPNLSANTLPGALTLLTYEDSATFNLTVDTSSDMCPVPHSTDYIYDLCAVMSLTDGNMYSFQGVNGVEVCYNGTNGGGIAPVRFCECPALVTINFVECDSNAPVLVTGNVEGDDPAGTCQGPQQALGSMVNTSTKQLLVRGGVTGYHLSIQAESGSDASGQNLSTAFFYYPPIDLYFDTVCDQEITVNVRLCACTNPPCPPCAYGTISGSVSMAGQCPLPMDGTWTLMRAEDGAFGNLRHDPVPITGSCSQGPFTLPNLFPSSVTPYVVWSEMGFLSGTSGNSYEFFVSPSTNCLVRCGAALDLGTTFAMDPGSVTGPILLRGPLDSPTSPSGLRYIVRDTAVGIPTKPTNDDIDLFYSSYVYAYITTATASGSGYARALFDGLFTALSTDFIGNYELLLSGLNSPGYIPSHWEPNILNLVFRNLTPVAPSPFLSCSYIISDNNFGVQAINAGIEITHPIDYCFSEVVLNLSPGGGISCYNPSIFAGSGGFDTKSDFQRNAANYGVNSVSASGTPTTQKAASLSGQIVVLLPQGTYTLSSAVYTAGGSYTEFPAINLTVGCGQRITNSTYIQLALTNLPSCSTDGVIIVSGSVHSTNSVSSITWVSDVPGASPTEVPPPNAGWGISPSFPLTLLPCTHSYTVSATDSATNTASVTFQVTLDDTPPVILCPSNIVLVSCSNVPVCYNVTATSACCSNVTVVSTPPSCSSFAPGTATTVNCLATDCCGNTASCSFTVTVSCASCMTVTNTSVECMATNMTYQWQFCITNNSTNIVKYLDFPDLPAGVGISEDIVALPTDLNPGGVACLTLYITNTAGLTNVCFTVGAHDADLDQCCSISNCIAFTPCCVSISQERLVPLPGGCYDYTFTVENTHFPPAPAEYLMLVQDPALPTNCVSFSPDILPLWTLAPGASTGEVVHVCIAAGCKGPYCFLLGAVDGNPCTNQCCSIMHCLPPVSCQPIIITNSFDGSVFPAGTITVPLVVDPICIEPRAILLYAGTNVIYIATNSVTSSTIVSVNWNNVVPGTYTLSAEVIDNLGGEWFSEPATVTVVKGQVARREPPGMLPPLKYADTAPTFSLATTAGVTYRVESSESLSGPQWTFVRSVVGDGSPITVTNSVPAASRRFYRVRPQR